MLVVVVVVVVVGSVVENWILSRQFPLLCSYRPNLTWSISLFDYTTYYFYYISTRYKETTQFLSNIKLFWSLWLSAFLTLNVKQRIILGTSGHLNRYFKSSPEESPVNQNQHSTLRSISCWNLKAQSQGCVFFLLLFTETESPSLQKSFRSAIVWILAEVWPYKIPTRSPGTNIFSQLLQNIFQVWR